MSEVEVVYEAHEVHRHDPIFGLRSLNPCLLDQRPRRPHAAAPMGALLDAGNTSLFGEIFAVLQALCALAVVAALFWFGRRALRSSRFGSRHNEHIRIEERVALDMRNALVIVRVEQRRLLLATSDQAPARLIAELSPGESARTREAPAGAREPRDAGTGG